jgi:transposase-like protein
MPSKRHKSQGQSVADAIRSIGVTEVMYYRWRQEFGGLKSDQVKRSFLGESALHSGEIVSPYPAPARLPHVSIATGGR